MSYAPDPGMEGSLRRVVEPSWHGESVSVFVWKVFSFVFIFDMADKGTGSYYVFHEQSVESHSIITFSHFYFRLRRRAVWTVQREMERTQALMMHFMNH